MSVADWAGVAVAALGVVATFLAWRAAATLARIEKERQHREQTPRIKVLVPGWLNPGSRRVLLEVRLTGPDGRDRLDAVRVRVRDDGLDHREITPGGPTREQLDATVWAPFRFALHADGADENGRTVAEFPLARGESHRLQMEPTLAPPTHNQADWQRQYADHPIRLEFTCRREGYEPWRITKDVDAPVG